MADSDNNPGTRHDRRGPPFAYGAGPGMAVGLIVIAVGVIFLLGNFGLSVPLPNRWWALFIFVPAVGSLVAGVRFYRADGRFSARAAGASTGGLLMLATATILFFDLPWGQFWPVMVIIVGLGIVTRGWGGRR